MRVALLSQLPSDPQSSLDHTAALRTALNQAGVHVLTPLQGQRPLSTLQAARAWVAERDWRRVDVVHADLADGAFSAFLVLAALAELPVRPALSATALAPDRLIWGAAHRSIRRARHAAAGVGTRRLGWRAIFDPLALMAERRLARKLEGLVAPNPSGAQGLAKRLKLNLQSVSVISPAVTAHPLAPIEDFSPIQLIHCGVPTDGEAFDLLEAFAKARALAPDATDRLRLTMAGSFEPMTPRAQRQAIEAALMARADRLGLTGRIDWRFDPDPLDRIAQIQSHHVVVVPQREPAAGWLQPGQRCGIRPDFGWALAAGRGVLTSDAQGNADEVRSGNGAVYHRGDIGALALRLTEICADPLCLHTWAQSAAAQALDRAPEISGQRYVGHFRRAMERVPVPRRQHHAPTTQWAE